MPIAVPRTRGENMRAMSAAAGPWYEPETIPSSTRSARSCQYEPAVASATLAAPIRKRPPTITIREPTRSASTPHGAFASPAAIENADTGGERDQRTVGGAVELVEVERVGHGHIFEANPRARREALDALAQLRRIALAARPLLIRRSQRSRQGQSLVTIVRREVTVARAYRETVGGPHGGAPGD